MTNGDTVGTVPPVLSRSWRHRLMTVTLVAVPGGISGTLWALLLPRGPVDSWSGLAFMATGLLLGTVAGLVLRRRRAVLLVLAAHAVAFELVRLPITGPAVDGIHLDSTFGVIALVTGRGLAGVLLALPALVGVIYGAGAARRRAGPQHGRPPAMMGRVLAAGYAVAVLGLAALVAQPGTTGLIADAGGAPLPGSVAELATVRLGGHDTTVMLRGRRPPGCRFPSTSSSGCTRSVAGPGRPGSGSTPWMRPRSSGSSCRSPVTGRTSNNPPASPR